MLDLVRHSVKEAERQGANDAEAFVADTSVHEVLIENNDIKQVKSQQLRAIGIRVIIGGSLGFYSINTLTKDSLQRAVSMAIKIAKSSPEDRYNSLPRKLKKGKFLHGLYDKAAQSFGASDAAKSAAELLKAAKSYDSRVSVDGGSFAVGNGAQYLANSNGIELKEKFSTFSWTIMGMAIENGDVSSFDFQSGASHFVKEIDVQSTAKEFAQTVTDSLGSRKIESFKGEMILTPSAVNELVEDAIAHSVNSDAVQKKSSHFAGKIGKKVSSKLLAVEDDGTDVRGLGASSFDREGVPHKRNVVIEKGVLKKFLYNTYTATKDGVRSTGNAGGSPASPPSVSTTNFIIRPGTASVDTMISEMKRGILISRFSGNVDPVNGDFSGVAKGARLIQSGSIAHAVREVMVAGNIFESLNNLSGVSKERKVIFDSILPYLRFENISFTAG